MYVAFVIISKSSNCPEILHVEIQMAWLPSLSVCSLVG